MARARKDERQELIEEPETDIQGLLAFLERLRAQIPQEVRDSLPDDFLTNMDAYMYGLQSPK